MDQFVFQEREPGFVNIVNCSIEDLRGWDVQWTWDFSGYPCPGFIPMGQLLLYYGGCSTPIHEFRVCSEGLLVLFARAINRATKEEKIFDPISLWVPDSGWKNVNEEMCNSWFWPMKMLPTPVDPFSIDWSNWSFTGVIPPEIWTYSPTEEELEKFSRENPGKEAVTTTEYCVAGANVRFQVFDSSGVLEGLLGKPRCIISNQKPETTIPPDQETEDGGDETEDCGCDCPDMVSNGLSNALVPKNIAKGMLPNVSEGILTINPRLFVRDLVIDADPVIIKINFIMHSFSELWKIDEPATFVNTSWRHCPGGCHSVVLAGWYEDQSAKYILDCDFILNDKGGDTFFDARITGQISACANTVSHTWTGRGTEPTVSYDNDRIISVQINSDAHGDLIVQPEITCGDCEITVKPLIITALKPDPDELKTVFISCWGASIPINLPAEDEIVSFSAGDKFVLVLLKRKSINRKYVISFYDDTTLSTQAINVPQVVQGRSKKVLAFGGLAAVILENKKVVMWGINQPTSKLKSTMIETDTLSDIIDFYGSPDSVVFIKEDGSAIAFGQGFGNSNTRHEISFSKKILKASCSSRNILFILEDGSVVLWGDQLKITDPVPADIKLLRNIIDISNAGSSYAILTSDGAVMAWGQGAFNELKMPEGLDSGVIKLRGSTDYFHAIKEDTMISWGAFRSTVSGDAVFPPVFSGVVKDVSCNNNTNAALIHGE